MLGGWHYELIAVCNACIAEDYLNIESCILETAGKHLQDFQLIGILSPPSYIGPRVLYCPEVARRRWLMECKLMAHQQ